MLADLIDNPKLVREREAVLLLSALVGAISMARAVDDAELSKLILTNAAAALKKRIPRLGSVRRPPVSDLFQGAC